MIESKVVKEWQALARQESSLEALLAVLGKRFGPLPQNVPLHLASINDAAVFRELLLKAIDASTIADFCREIPNGVQ